MTVSLLQQNSVTTHNIKLTAFEDYAQTWYTPPKNADVHHSESMGFARFKNTILVMYCIVIKAVSCNPLRAKVLFLPVNPIRDHFRNYMYCSQWRETSNFWIPFLFVLLIKRMTFVNLEDKYANQNFQKSKSAVRIVKYHLVLCETAQWITSLVLHKICTQHQRGRHLIVLHFSSRTRIKC